MLAGEELLEAAQPRGKCQGGRVPGDGLRGRADGVDLIDVEGFQELSAAGAYAFGVPPDVTDGASVAAAAGLIEEHAGGLDVLVNNAGITGAGRRRRPRSIPR